MFGNAVGVELAGVNRQFLQREDVEGRQPMQLSSRKGSLRPNSVFRVAISSMLPLRGLRFFSKDSDRFERLYFCPVLVRDYLTTTEFARLSGLSRATVARLVDKGRIPARRVGSHRRLYKADLEAAGLLRDGTVRGHRLLRRQDLFNLASTIKEIAADRGASNVRLFGSLARNSGDEISDVDLLVDLEPGRSLWDLAGLELDLEALLKTRVDVGTVASLKPHSRSRILAESVPL